MKIGILGGTFNPIHKGHLFVAREAQKQMKLDQVLVMPAGDPPHKDEITSISRSQRFALVKETLKAEDGLTFFPYEYTHEGQGYSYIILGELKKLYPKDDLYFIIGEDSFLAFETWVKPEVISTFVKFAVIRRNDCGGMSETDLSALSKLYQKKYRTEFIILSTDTVDCSSTELRRLLYSRKSLHDSEKKLKKYLPEAAYDYILAHRLYESFPVTEDGGPFDFAVAYDKLQKKLTPHRYRHSLGVEDTCAALAAAWNYPVRLARMAGILHDCAKSLSDSKYFKVCEKNGISISPAEQKAPYLLHAKVGSVYAEKKYGVTDEEILEAIRVHTTGKPGMGLLDKILFVADYIEPGRDKAQDLENIRQTAYQDLDLCCEIILKNTLDYLKKSGAEVDRTTADTYEYFHKLMQQKRAAYPEGIF